VVAAKPKRDLKLSKLQLKERSRGRKQRDQRGSGHEVAKPRLLRNDHKNNESGLTVSIESLGCDRHRRLDMASRTLVCLGLLPVATTRHTMSRSVIIA
jgi:hypothetical protein